jgi:hypothetical protein
MDEYHIDVYEDAGYLADLFEEVGLWVLIDTYDVSPNEGAVLYRTKPIAPQTFDVILDTLEIEGIEYRIV